MANEILVVELDPGFFFARTGWFNGPDGRLTQLGSSGRSRESARSNLDSHRVAWQRYVAAGQEPFYDIPREIIRGE